MNLVLRFALMMMDSFCWLIISILLFVVVDDNFSSMMILIFPGRPLIFIVARGSVC